MTLGAFGGQPGWQLGLSLGALGVLTVAGLVFVVRRRRKDKASDV
ncbi:MULTISPECIES: LPXTG cell wall anchor domain-containing protein [unclassified Arthrobacter]